VRPHPLLPRPLLFDAGVQLLLLAGGLGLASLALTPVEALGWRGAIVAFALYGVIAAFILNGLSHHAPHHRFGLANSVTLSRAAAAALFVGIVGDGASLGENARWVLVAIGTVALLLDGVDGWAARRSGLASAFGARFDMEVDALFILALSALVQITGQAGPWVLLSGFLRYIFVGAGWVWPRLASPLPPSLRRKAICVIQGAVLVTALAPPVGPDLARFLCLGALALLIYSFAADGVWLVAGTSKRVMMAFLQPTPALDARLLRRVDHAITDARRGAFFLLHHAGQAFLVQAAETVSSESLARLTDLAPGQSFLVLTRRRAAALAWAAAPTGPKGTVLLRLPGGVDATALRDLADPTAPTQTRLSVTEATGFDGAADAAIELVKLARLLPAAILAPVSAAEAQRLGHEEGMLSVGSSDILAYQATASASLRQVSEARVPLADAIDTRILAFRPSDGGIEHIAIVIGRPAGDVLVRLHSECFTGDLLGSLRCDCGDQLRGAIAEIAEVGSGVLLYLAQEGRGIGLVNKLRAYELQDSGHDTIDANEELGFDADERVYLPAAEMLRQLGFTRVRLLTNNPEKVAALTRCGIAVIERVPHIFPANGHNDRYLRTKATRSGHLL